jgi:polyphosphate kinase 2 (PPK2 family)
MSDELFDIDGEQVSLEQLIESWKTPKMTQVAEKALSRRNQEQSMKPYQAELIRMQQLLEETGRRMFILFEGRDASG